VPHVTTPLPLQCILPRSTFDMSNTDFLGRAIDVVKKAIEQDTAGEYDKAYQLYYQART
jgi:hypothetical protein